MINLLPPELKENYRYARRNRALLRWITACVLCLAGGALLVTGGHMYLNQTVQNETQAVNSTQQQLQTEHLASVQKQVATITNNLKLVVKVLSKETLFSKLLKQLATVTPNDVALTNLSITQDQSGVDITAQTANYNAATQLQVNLSDPSNQIFSKADIISINCSQSSTSTTVSAYPCVANLRALFNPNSPFLFINAKGNS